MSLITASNLSDHIEFDCPFRVNDDGSVELNLDIYAPSEVNHDNDHDMLIDGVPYRDHPDWESLTGYTGQYGYNGPVMHESEYLGGGLARDIIAEPGEYVVVVVYGEIDEESEDEYYPQMEPCGWAVLRRK